MFEFFVGFACSFWFDVFVCLYVLVVCLLGLLLLFVCDVPFTDYLGVVVCRYFMCGVLVY